MKEIFKNVKEKLVGKYLDNNISKKTKKFKPRIKARIRKNNPTVWDFARCFTGCGIKRWTMWGLGITQSDLFN